MPYTPNVQQTTSQVVAPNAYRLRSIILSNHAKTKEVDIRNLVTDFSVTESIYLHTLVLDMNVKDFANVMERMGISGQEKITVTFSRKGLGEDEVDVSHTFVVTEYPVYGKFNNRVQVYSVKGVSEHAFLSRLKRISRAKKDSIKTIISEILQKDLNLKPEKVLPGSEASGIVDVVIPYSHPADAIHWLSRRAFDSYGSPFYCYETLGEGVRIESLGEMMVRGIHRTFKDNKFFTEETQTQGDYEQRLSRILSMASDLNLSKFSSASAGAYASSTGYLDIQTKSFNVETFNYSDAFPSMRKLDAEKTISDTFTLEENLPLSKYYGAHFNYIPLNTSRENSYNSITRGKSINLAQSYVENLDTIVHDITVMGDFTLHPGQIVELALPKAVDPNQEIKSTDLSSNRELDELLSGKYLVTSVIHNFSEDYTCTIRVKKDSFKKDYFAKTSK